MGIINFSLSKVNVKKVFGKDMVEKNLKEEEVK